MQKLQAHDPETQSLDLVADNIAKLTALFPEILTEGADGDKRVDFEALRELLGTAVEDKEERYNFTWHGKREARRLAQTPSTGTLRPCPAESKDWDSTQNLFIEGDNLEVLKLLQKSYHQRVKMIYIDPPYNTGKDFIYPDNYRDNIANYLEVTGQVEGGRKLSANPETSGRYHTHWLNMMYPRLKLARNLLREDGVIFISIDDTEVANLRKLCDEIFGEENCLGVLTWKKKTNGNNMGEIPPVHDYIIVYAKRFVDNILLGRKLGQDYINKNYSNPDNDPRGAWTTSDLSANHEGPYFPIINPNTKVTYYPPTGRYWVFNENEVHRRINDGRIIFGKTGNAGPVQKKYLEDRSSLRCKVDSWWDSHGLNEDGTAEINELIATKAFTHPKPSLLIRNLVDICLEEGIVLDFFAGSGTTAHAVMALNAEDGGNRQFIMVQLPEPTDKPDYPTIADIGKERIRRAGEKIRSDNAAKDGINNLDVGFKVFKLDSTNIKPWDVSFDTLETDILHYADNLKPDRSNDDVLYEILLKYGLDLSTPMTTHTLAGKTVHSIGGALLVCLDNALSLDVVEGIAKLKDELQPETAMRVVFRDASFTDDVVKVNAVQILKQAGIDDVRSV